MAKTYWISKHVGNVREVAAKRPADEDGFVSVLGSYSLFRLGRDIWETEEEALADAKKRVEKKIASLTKQIDVLRKGTITVTRLGGENG